MYGGGIELDRHQVARRHGLSVEVGRCGVHSGWGLEGYQLGIVGDRSEKLSLTYTGGSSESRWESRDLSIDVSGKRSKSTVRQSG